MKVNHPLNAAGYFPGRWDWEGLGPRENSPFQQLNISVVNFALSFDREV